MSKVLSKHGTLLAVALMLLLIVTLLPISASADGTVYIKPEKLQGEPLSGTGWSYDGTTLTLQEGYNFAIDSSTSVTCKVINYGTLVGGVVGCHFTGDLDNYGTIENAAFSCTLTNYGRITDSQFNAGCVMTNAESGVVEGVESWCILKDEVENYGTIKKSIVSGTVNNYGTIDEADCFVISTVNNYNNATINNSEIVGEFANAGIIESTTVNVEFTNAATGNIKSGTFNEAVTNNGTISGGEFANKVVNNALITNGTFNRVLSDGTYKGSVENHGTISGGNFNCTVTNYSVCENGNFYNAVSNFGTLSGGNYYDTVTNEGTISNGTFSAGVVNHKTVTGGTFKGLIANSGTVSGCNAVAANYDSASGSTSYVVCGEATLSSDIILSNGDSMTVPEGAKLIIPNGVTLNAVKGALKVEGDIEVQNGGALITTAIQEESHNWAVIIGKYTKDSVTEADRETLSNAVAKIDELLASNDLDDDTRAVLEKAKAGANELLAYLDEVKDAPVTDGEKEPPKTGDERNFGLIFAIMLLSATVTVFTYEKKKN